MAKNVGRRNDDLLTRRVPKSRAVRRAQASYNTRELRRLSLGAQELPVSFRAPRETARQHPLEPLLSALETGAWRQLPGRQRKTRNTCAEAPVRRSGNPRAGMAARALPARKHAMEEERSAARGSPSLGRQKAERFRETSASANARSELAAPGVAADRDLTALSCGARPAGAGSAVAEKVLLA